MQGQWGGADGPHTLPVLQPGFLDADAVALGRLARGKIGRRPEHARPAAVASRGTLLRCWVDWVGVEAGSWSAAEWQRSVLAARAVGARQVLHAVVASPCGARRVAHGLRSTVWPAVAVGRIRTRPWELIAQGASHARPGRRWHWQQRCVGNAERGIFAPAAKRAKILWWGQQAGRRGSRLWAQMDLYGPFSQRPVC